jgi:protein TonB
MFEQASIESPGLPRRPLALGISFVSQVAAVTAVALFSLLHTDVLPRGFFFTHVVAPGRDAPPVSGSRRKAATRTPLVKADSKIFHVPSVIPRTVQMGVIDEPEAPPAGIASDNGVPGGIGLGDPRGFQLIDAPRSPPAPPAAKPAAQEKAASAPAARTPINVSKGVQEAKLIRQVTPAYPALARSARISGTVRLTAIIGRDGAIQHLQLISGHPLLTAAAIDAVKQWLYRPTLLNNEAVEVITQIDVNFTLSR